MKGIYSGSIRETIVRTYDTRPSTAEKMMDILEIIDRIAKSEYCRGVDVATQKRGKWIPEKYGGHKCSVCGEYPLQAGDESEELSDYCPHCGADMRWKECWGDIGEEKDE